MLLHWWFGGCGEYTGCSVYSDSQSVGSEWFINHRCPVQVDKAVEQKLTSQQGHPIHNGICPSVHTG